MAKCACCGSTILFGGKRIGDLRFCNETCRSKGSIPFILNQVPTEAVEKYIQEVHAGPCPMCRRHGPVDVHTSYLVLSAILLTHTSTRQHICCKSCGKKKKLLDALCSLFFGWWGFPWGIIFTPVYVLRNLSRLFKSPDPSTPSPQLVAMLKAQMAQELTQVQRSGGLNIG